MASVYTRKDSKELWLACYPRAGGPFVRTSLETTDAEKAEQILKKIEMLIALERMGDVSIPKKLLAHFQAADGHRAKSTDGPLR